MLVALVAIADAVDTTPPRQTPYQADLMRTVRKDAAEASAAARPELLKLMDSAAFRNNVSAAYPAARSASAEDMLNAFVEELGVAEFVHNFRATEPVSGTGGHRQYDDIDVALGRNSTYFQNLWELVSTGFHKPKELNTITDAAETGIMGFREFSQFPPPFEESMERPVYTAVNHFKVDMGNPGFGNVSAVFQRSEVDNMTMIMGIDTGIIEFSCNKSLHMNFSEPVDCQYLLAPETLRTARGTTESLYHLLLVLEKSWLGGGALATTFSRTFSRDWGTPALDRESAFKYMEANIVGAPFYPKAIKFMIGSFPYLFGSEAGESLRAWCRERGWPLVWAIGLPDDHSKDQPLYALNGRVVDPTLPTTNASATDADARAFHSMWTKVAGMRAAGDDSFKEVKALWSGFVGGVSDSLIIEPVRARACSDPRVVIGLDANGKCVASRALIEYSE